MCSIAYLLPLCFTSIDTCCFWVRRFSTNSLIVMFFVPFSLSSADFCVRKKLTILFSCSSYVACRSSCFCFIHDKYSPYSCDSVLNRSDITLLSSRSFPYLSLKLHILICFFEFTIRSASFFPLSISEN